MAKITNKHGLPAQYVAAAEASQRTWAPKRISVTELVGPPQIRHLRHLYDDDIEIDVADLLASLRGNAWHEYLARFTASKDVGETTLRVSEGEWMVSGTPDHVELLLLDSGVLTDHKTTSIYAIRDGVKKEFEQQLNLYRLLLLRAAGVTVTSLRLVVLLDGWMASRAATDKSYPQTRAIMMDVEMWPIAKAEAFLAERLALHRTAEERGQYPECTPQERWLRPPSWRIVKKGGKRATRVCDSEAMAKKLMAELDPEQKGLYRVDFVWPTATRCESYCSVSRFCVQFQEWQRRAGARPAPDEAQDE